MVAYRFVALCLAGSSSARRFNRIVSDIEDNIETRCFFFTVEVRRRPRLAITSNRHVQSSETKSPQAGFDRESHCVAAAAFEARKADPSPVDGNRLQGAEFFRASSPRSRYVVRSETPYQPRQSLTLLRGRQSGGIKHPNCCSLGFSSAANAPLADGLSPKSRQPSNVQSDEGACVSPRVGTTEQSQVVGNSGGLALGAKARRRDQVAISLDDVGVRRLPCEQRSAIGTDSPATLPSRVDDRSPQGRKRTIMARYVFGDELKPGERWKRRLLTSR